MTFPAGWIVPDWPAPPGVKAACSTRSGGVSPAPFDTLNLGDHVGDDPRHVAHNRCVFAAALGARPVFLQQVHGRDCAVLARDSADGTRADGAVTSDPGVACTIMVADCLPVLFAAKDGLAVGAAHAGWRGLCGEGGQGVIESVWHALCGVSPCKPLAPAETMAWLGPCIGPQAFEVGPEVKAAFETFDAGAAACFQAHTQGKWLADLPGLARRRLRALGITRIFGNDGSADWCTASNPSRFFSHRRDRVSGRFAASVWLR